MQLSHGVLIVDDEALARQRLRQLLHDAPDFAVVGECADGREAAMDRPISAPNIRRASATVRVNGPAWSQVRLRGTTPTTGELAAQGTQAEAVDAEDGAAGADDFDVVAQQEIGVARAPDGRLSIGESLVQQHAAGRDVPRHRAARRRTAGPGDVRPGSPSPMNCMISSPRLDPTLLRIPTSRALRSERAVARFIKLIQAISKIKPAIAENIFTYSILPPTSTPFSYRPYR